MKSVMNMTTQLLAYSDITETDNPQKRDFDWTRRIHSLSVNNPSHDKVTIAPGQSIALFDGVSTSNLQDSTTTLSIESVDKSVYKLKASTTSSNFREARVFTNLSGCTVSINNNSVATFDLGTATVNSQVGDILRIAGSCCYDSAPYKFSSLNSGIWSIISISGSKIQCVRPTGIPFSGINETVTSITSNDIESYSSTGIQNNDKLEISGGFSSVSQRVYQILDVRANEILFSSIQSIPEEMNIVYNLGDINFYSNDKKVFYLETDQSINIKFNNDSSTLNKVDPIKPADNRFVGIFYKYGSAYKIVIENTSINTANILYFTAE